MMMKADGLGLESRRYNANLPFLDLERGLRGHDGKSECMAAGVSRSAATARRQAEIEVIELSCHRRQPVLPSCSRAEPRSLQPVAAQHKPGTRMR